MATVVLGSLDLICQYASSLTSDSAALLHNLILRGNERQTGFIHENDRSHVLQMFLKTDWPQMF